jgi:hypothetical protein
VDAALFSQATGESSGLFIYYAIMHIQPAAGCTPNDLRVKNLLLNQDTWMPMLPGHLMRIFRSLNCGLLSLIFFKHI